MRTWRLKVRAESYLWLNQAAGEVNQVWNWANATSFKAARPFAGRGKLLAVADESPAPCKAEVGIDLGLKDTAVTSDADRLRAGEFYRSLEQQIGRAQRRGHKAQAKRLHRTAARRRRNALHRFSRRIVNSYQNIIIGDVSSLSHAKTRMAKSVLDSGWGLLKAQLQYKGQWAGRSVRIVNESHTSRTCSSCWSLTGPKGVNGLRVRLWTCHQCGVTHDRDVNAARVILAVGRLLPSVCGNEQSQRSAPSSRASRPRKTRKAPGAVAA